MNARRICQGCVAVAFLLAAGTAMAAIFTWTQGGPGLNWDQCGNWDACSGLPGYPATTGDDAIIPQDGREWGGDPIQFRVNLITEQIDDLHIKEDTKFDMKVGETDPLLTCDTVQIDGEEGSVLVVISDAGIVTQ
jgi:hypothetical protein